MTEASQVRVAYDEALQMLDHPDAEDILKAEARWRAGRRPWP